jgi:DtxR family Mn-dependent transcriptional regulator
MKNSFTEENYLKAIYKLSERDELVTTTDIATILDIRAATVTDMLKKLAVKKLIRYERYKGLKPKRNITDVVLMHIRLRLSKMILLLG